MGSERRAPTEIPGPPTGPAASFITVTKPGTGGDSGQERRCRWCGRPIEAQPGAQGRPRQYCRQSCRQRDFEARRRSRELGLAESEVVMARHELSRLDDMLYVLTCALEDVERDLAGEHDQEDVRRSLDWLMDAARPLAELSRRGLL